jgi:hypothetical protein
LNIYAKHGGRIGFVLPRSVFTSDQHDRFRRATFGKAIHQTGLTEVWDLQGVAPLFNVPSCVVFGKHFHHTAKPIPARVFANTLARKNTSIEEAEKGLTVRETKLHVVEQGGRSFWSEDTKAEFAGRSPYAGWFAQGATIVPRSCWFVEIKTNGGLGFNPTKPFVRTDPRATEQAKHAYEDLIIEGNIEKEFLYATLLSTDLLPFGFLDYRIVVLPIKESGDFFILLRAKQASKDGNDNLAQWIETCEKEWNKRRGEKAKKESLLDWLDYRHKLTEQKHSAKYKVIYPTSATNLCGAVVENEKIAVDIAGQKINLEKFVTESTTYCFDTDNRDESYYLSALLNSSVLDQLLKPMQARGLWGPRHIHKKVWELPIPPYKEMKSEHRELATLGIHCTDKVKKLLPTLDTKGITPGKIGRLRNEVRKRLVDELKEIDGIVKEIMKKSSK